MSAVYFLDQSIQLIYIVVAILHLLSSGYIVIMGVRFAILFVCFNIHIVYTVNRPLLLLSSSVKMRKATTNVLIANQSGIDFSASMFIVLCTFIRDVNTIPGGRIAREIFCRMWATNMPIWGLFVSSSYNLVCITMERFSGICYPMRHARTCSKGKVTYT